MTFKNKKCNILYRNFRISMNISIKHIGFLNRDIM